MPCKKNHTYALLGFIILTIIIHVPSASAQNWEPVTETPLPNDVVHPPQNALRSTYSEYKDYDSYSYNEEQQYAFHDAPSEIDSLRAEIAELRYELNTINDRNNSADIESEPVVKLASLQQLGNQVPSDLAMNDPNMHYITSDELQAQLETMSWKKGPFTVTPYGIFWFSVSENSEKMVEGDFPLFVLSPDQFGESEAFFDAKSTRFGTIVEAPAPNYWPEAKVTGCFEFDFQGQFANTRNRGGVLFRKGFIQIEDDCHRILMGQTWDIMSPLYPKMLAYTPAMGAGNMGYRRAMLLYERKFQLSSDSRFVAQIAPCSTILTGYAGAINDLDSGPGGWPDIQWRFGYAHDNSLWSCQPYTLGVSGHIGETFHEDNSPPQHEFHQTWSLNVDFDIPVTDRLTVQGEAFMGTNLAAYLGGVIQSISPVTHQNIRSRGGWIGVDYQLCEDWATHSGFGLDDPINGDFGFNQNNQLPIPLGARTYNSVFWWNLTYNVNKYLLIGFEFSHWHTNWVAWNPSTQGTPPGSSQPLRPGDAQRYEFVAKLAW